MELLIQPLDRLLQVPPGANLLETLRANEVPISYSCMAGRCGTCRCKVISGHVFETGREEKITNPSEGDYVLACTSVLTENCAIEIPEPDEIVTHPARIIKATVAAIEDATHDIKLFGFNPVSPCLSHLVNMQRCNLHPIIVVLIRWPVSALINNSNFTFVTYRMVV